MQTEMDSLLKNDTWKLVDLPNNRKAIPCKWVSKIKRNEHGYIEKYKARLVAKVFAQKFGIDYNETFAPVTRFSSIRLILALAVEYDMYVHQIDVTTAYLNGKLKEDIYMKQPEYYVDSKFPHNMCKLNKTFGHEWNSVIDSCIKKLGFNQCAADLCVYTQIINNEICIIAIYVDDIAIACKNIQRIVKLKQHICQQFDVIDKNEISFCLGIQIERNISLGEIKIHQKQYIESILMKYNIINMKSAYTPLNPSVKLVRGTKNKIDSKYYQSIVGSIMYLAVNTRPDIQHAVNTLSQFNNDPTEEHLDAAKHLLRYINTTINFKICYRKSSIKDPYCYVDADWGGNLVDRRSYTGYVFFMANGPVTWESKKQTTVALSSTEAEYMALTQATKEAIYLRNLLSQMQFQNIVTDPTKMYSDNLSSQQLVKHPIYHARTKHIDIKHHYVRDKYKDGDVTLVYTSTNDMVADVLTKGLQKIKHMKFANCLGKFN